MAIISADEYLKQKGVTPSGGGSSGGGIMTAEQYLASKGTSPTPTPTATPQPTASNQPSALDRAWQFANKRFIQEPEVFERDSVVPEDWGNVPVASWLGENIVAPTLRPLEQFGRLIPATGYEVGRWAESTFNPLDPENFDQEKYNRLTSKNPFVPGLERANQGDILNMVMQRSGKAMLDLALLKGASGLASQGWKGMVKAGALEGAAAPFTQTEGGSPLEAGVTSAAGAVLAPVAGTAMKYAPVVADLVKGKVRGTVPGLPDSVAAMWPKMVNEAIGETAIIKVPTPAELAFQRAAQRNAQLAATKIDYPAGTGITPEGAVQVPPGGFSPFEPQGTQQLREAIPGFNTGDNPNFATQLLYDVLGPRKTRQLQKKLIAERIGEPFPSPERILTQPVGQRPPPVLGKFKVERPFFTEMPTEVKVLSEVIAPEGPSVVPPKITRGKYSRFADEPIEMKTPSKLHTLSQLWTPMQDFVKKMGKSGEALAKAIDDMRASEYNMRGGWQNQIQKMFKKMSPNQELNFFEAAQGLAAPMDDVVAHNVNANNKLANMFFTENTNRGMLENMVDNTGSPIIDPNNYISHMINDLGWNHFEFNENAFFEKIAKHNMKPGDNFDQVLSDVINDWKFIQSNRTPPAFFERKRTWSIPPEYLERNPLKIWNRYAASAAKRYALLDTFGAEDLLATDKLGNKKPGYERLNQMIADIVMENGQNNGNFAQNATDMIIGRYPTDFAFKRAVADLQEFQLISKISPLTTLSNLQQGMLASVNQHGFKYMLQGLADVFSPSGREFGRKTGLIGEQSLAPTGRYPKMANLWKKITGFPISEDFNFQIISNSTKHFLTDMFGKLQKNPNSQSIRQHFKLHGLDADELLKKGMIEEKDLLKGAFIAGRDTIFPKLVEQAPKWTADPGGRLLYQFAHYGLKQPGMLGRQFKVSKTRGMTSLLKFLATQAVLGEPVADIWALLKGRERPEDLPNRLAENILYSGSLGIYGEGIRSLTSGKGLSDLVSPGPTIAGGMEAVGRLYNDAAAGDPLKFMEDLVRQKAKGNIPGGPPIPAGNFFEGLIEREPLQRKDTKKKGKIRDITL